MSKGTAVVRLASMDQGNDADGLSVTVPLPNAPKESIDLIVSRDWPALRALGDNEEASRPRSITVNR
jgi:hypothetical protein